jgi:acetyl esterase
VLRDEGEQYARKLIEAGVDVTPIRMLATHHDYALLNPLANTPATRATIQLASEKLSDALSSRSRESIAA